MGFMSDLAAWLDIKLRFEVAGLTVNDMHSCDPETLARIKAAIAAGLVAGNSRAKSWAVALERAQRGEP